MVKRITFQAASAAVLSLVFCSGNILAATLTLTDNLAVWLDASDIDGDGDTGDNPINGTAIGEGGIPWVNKATGFGVGNAVTATEESGDAPLYVTDGGLSLNNLPALGFDGDSSGLKIAHDVDLNATEGLSIFVVSRYDDAGFRFMQKGDGFGTGAGDWFGSPNSGQGVAGTFKSPVYSGSGGVHIFESVYDPTSGTFGGIQSLLDGSLRGGELFLSSSYTSANSNPLFLGRRNNSGGSQGFLDGLISEILIYTDDLSATDRDTVGFYLQEKYGIAGAYVGPPVPEPSSFCLLLLGLLALGKRRHARRH